MRFDSMTSISAAMRVGLPSPMSMVTAAPTRSSYPWAKPAGANALPFEMQNVLFVGSKLQLIQEMLQTREVVGSA